MTKENAQTNKPDLSVVIVNYNTRELILNCLESLVSHAGKLKLEIIVVDNKSSDDSVARIAELYPNVQIIKNKNNEGFARANNTAFALCGSDYVLLLNPDTEVRANCLQTSLKHIQSQPRIGALGCRVMFESGEHQPTIFRFLNLRQLFYAIFLDANARARSAWFGDARYASLAHDQVQSVDVITGCFMLVPSDLISLTGGMDNNFFMYAEEAEWCFRIKQHDYTVEYFPSAEIMHHGAASSDHLTEWKMIEMARGHLIFLHLTRGLAIAQIGCILMLLATIPRLAYYCLLSLGQGSKKARENHPIVAKVKFLVTVLFTPKRQLQHSASSTPDN
jgi:GT2 family glycosyltransferase